MWALLGLGASTQQLPFFLSCESFPPGWRLGWNGVSCHFCADRPQCRKARSSNEEGPTAAQGQIGGRLENSKESLIIMVIFLTYFIQPWHFASKVPSNSTVVLRHHDEDFVFGCFQLLFLILSKAICQHLNKDNAKEPASLIHALSLSHEFCAEMWRTAIGLLYSVTVTVFGMKNQTKLYAAWQNYWGKECCRLLVLMRELLSVSEFMILWLDTNNASELNASHRLTFSIAQQHAAGVVLTR